MKSQLVVIDTEFTSFSEPKLWSLGAVTSSQWFYGEILPNSIEGASLLRLSSDFVKQEVIPQFGKVPNRSYASLSQLGEALGMWLATHLSPSTQNPVIFAYDSEHDADLVKDALRSAGQFKEPAYFKFLNVADVTAVAVAQMAIEDYLDTSALKKMYSLKAHHALLDAYALQMGLATVTKI